MNWETLCVDSIIFSYRKDFLSMPNDNCWFFSHRPIVRHKLFAFALKRMSARCFKNSVDCCDCWNCSFLFNWIERKICKSLIFLQFFSLNKKVLIPIGLEKVDHAHQCSTNVYTDWTFDKWKSSHVTCHTLIYPMKIFNHFDCLHDSSPISNAISHRHRSHWH